MKKQQQRITLNSIPFALISKWVLIHTTIVFTQVKFCICRLPYKLCLHYFNEWKQRDVTLTVSLKRNNSNRVFRGKGELLFLTNMKTLLHKQPPADNLLLFSFDNIHKDIEWYEPLHRKISSYKLKRVNDVLFVIRSVIISKTILYD